MKSLFRSERAATKTGRRCTKLQVGTLDARELPSATAFNNGGFLYIIGTDDKEIVSVNTVGSYFVSVYDGSNQSTQIFLKSDINTNCVVFLGLGGDDYFSNNVNTFQSVAYGGNGNDTLQGANGVDQLYGE